MGFYTSDLSAVAIRAKEEPGASRGVVLKKRAVRFFRGARRQDSLSRQTKSPASKAVHAVVLRTTAPGVPLYGYRHLSTQLGRWVNRDPIWEHGGFNLYAMVKNSAIVFCDILGNGDNDVPPCVTCNIPLPPHRRRPPGKSPRFPRIPREPPVYRRKKVVFDQCCFINSLKDTSGGSSLPLNCAACVYGCKHCLSDPYCWAECVSSSSYCSDCIGDAAKAVIDCTDVVDYCWKCVDAGTRVVAPISSWPDSFGLCRYDVGCGKQMAFPSSSKCESVPLGTYKEQSVPCGK